MFSPQYCFFSFTQYCFIFHKIASFHLCSRFFYFVAIFTFHTFHFHFSWYLHFVSSSLQTQCTFTGKQFTSWCCNPILWKILPRLRSKSSSPSNILYLHIQIQIRIQIQIQLKASICVVIQSSGKFFQA